MTTPNRTAAERSRRHRASRRRRLVGAVAAPGVLAAAVAAPLLAGSGGAGATTAPAARAAAAAPRAAAPAVRPLINPAGIWTPQIFGPTSAFRQKVTSAPVNADSRAMVADLAHQVSSRYGGTAAFNVWKYGATIIEVPGNQRRVTVKYDDCQHKGHTPSQVYSRGKHFVGVPIPDSAKPSAGSDAGMTVWSPDTDQLWSFWKVKRRADGWHACWGGRIDHLWTSAGYFPDGMGASASGLAAGGAIRIDEVRNGRIPHAVSIGILDYAGWKNYSWPAQRSDGSTASRSKILMGTRFRLPKSVDVDELGLTPIGRLVARAAQDYGLIVTEKSGAVAFAAESGATTKARTGTDPWTALLAGTPSYQVMENFPWSRLQALQKDYGRR